MTGLYGGTKVMWERRWGFADGLRVSEEYMLRKKGRAFWISNKLLDCRDAKSQNLKTC